MKKKNNFPEFSLGTPEQLFVFQEAVVSGTAENSRNKLRFYFVFNDQEKPEKTARDIARQISMPELTAELERHAHLANFKAKSGQILFLVEEAVILGGLGKQNQLHPEQVCELLFTLSKKLIQLKNVLLEIHITDEFLLALQEHQNKSKDFSSRLDIDLKRKVKPKPAKQKQQTEAEAAEKRPSEFDFIANVDANDMLSQIVVCLNMGAEAMELCKSKTLQKQTIPVYIQTPSLASELVYKALKRGKNLSGALHGARYIASLPGNYMDPESYEEYARNLAKEHKLNIDVFDETALRRMGCGGILAVGQGSVIPPRMIVLQYKPSHSRLQRPLLFVGKGITFDTGGISIKPAAAMHEMKYDMCGSALALHAIAYAAAQKLELPVTALLGIAENMPDGKAIKPGDVYTAYNGSTVEVQNTDAEGRLVLGDVLAYACHHYDPLCLLDFATLTGACVVALGNEAAGVMTASEDLAQRIHQASLRSLDRVWRLPHWSVYGRGLQSEIADQRNIAGKGAGTVSAMRFLAHFVDKDVPWAHFDIAGAAWRDKPYGSQSKGATGWGLRLLSCLMEDLLAKAPPKTT